MGNVEMISKRGIKELSRKGVDAEKIESTADAIINFVRSQDLSLQEAIISLKFACHAAEGKKQRDGNEKFDSLF